MQQHVAIYVNGQTVIAQLIKALQMGVVLLPVFIPNLTTATVFATFTIDTLLEEEITHDASIVAATSKPLQYRSSGEKKKFVLSYLLQKKPSTLIICNVFDYIDKETKPYFTHLLATAATTTHIIQIVQRKADILPFIKQQFLYENNTIIAFKETSTSIYAEQTIPLPLTNITVDYDLLIRFSNVSISYNQQPVLHSISFTIKSGTFCELLGPNGSGKSTILSMIVGDNAKAYNQQIELFGRKKGTGESIWDIKQKIGYYSSSAVCRFNKMDSVLNMIIGGLFDSIGLYKIPTSAQIEKGFEWLQLLQLQHSANKPFKFLSHAQQRMVLIARGMIKHPPLLILDEPTADVSDDEAMLIVTLINKIAKETNTAILYVSHTKEEGLKPTQVFELVPTNQGSIIKQLF